MLNIKSLKSSFVLSLFVAYPLLSEAVTVTNARNDWIPEVSFHNPVDGYCRDVAFFYGDQIVSFIQPKNGETIGYVIPADKSVCVTFYYAALDTQRKVIGPVSGANCEIRAYYEEPKIGIECTCSGSEDRCKRDQ